MSYNISLPHPKEGQKPEYNSTRETLKMPAYGRMVQKLVEYAITIEDRTERQRYAEGIVQVMVGLTAKTGYISTFLRKVWNHLAYISDYKLDIDYPYPIDRIESNVKPSSPLSYPKSSIRFRHYGRLIETAMERLKDMPEGPERDAYVRLIANRMKRNLADWKGDGVQDEKVAQDIAYYTDDKVAPDFSHPDNALMFIGENRFRTRKNKGMF